MDRRCNRIDDTRYSLYILSVHRSQPSLLKATSLLEAMEPTQPIHEAQCENDCSNEAHRFVVYEWGDHPMEYDVVDVCRSCHAQMVIAEFKGDITITHTEVLPDTTDDGTLIPEHAFTPVSTENPVGIVVDTVEVVE